MTDATTTSDEASIRAVAQIVQDNKGEKRRAASTLLELLQYQATDDFHKQGAQTLAR